MSKIFIDTNILIYSADIANPEKQKLSRKILKNIQDKHVGVISTQVIQEFYVVATKKLNINPLNAKDIIHNFENFEIVIISPQIIKDAIDCSILNQISFWDSLIIMAAESSKCEKVYTEDLNNKQIINGIIIENPFINGTQMNADNKLYFNKDKQDIKKD